MSELTPTRVMVVDDHAIVRKGIVFTLLAFDDIEVVAEAPNGEQALNLCPQVRPDVILMDLLMPGMGGIEAIRQLRQQCPDARTLVISSFQEGNLVQEALEAGAIGYLIKDISADELAKAVRLAHHDMPSLAPTAAQALVHTVAPRGPRLGYDLTEREREVLRLLAEGLSNQAIAERLVISTATVKFHTRSIRSKLGTTTRTETAVLALQHRLVQAP